MGVGMLIIPQIPTPIHPSCFFDSIFQIKTQVNFFFANNSKFVRASGEQPNEFVCP